MPLNSFGNDWQSAQNKWSKDVCQKDSDGDGLTNGEVRRCRLASSEVDPAYTAQVRPCHGSLLAHTGSCHRPAAAFACPTIRQELGDPCCTWTAEGSDAILPGGMTLATYAVSHPGFASSKSSKPVRAADFCAGARCAARRCELYPELPRAIRARRPSIHHN